MKNESPPKHCRCLVYCGKNAVFEVLCKLSNRYSLSLPIKIYSQEPAQEERSQECSLLPAKMVKEYFVAKSLQEPVFVFFSRRQDNDTNLVQKRQTERVRLSHSLTILGNSVYKQDRILFGYVCCEIAPV